MLTNKIDKETRFPLLVVIKKFAVLFLIIADFRDSTLHRTTLNSILLVASFWIFAVYMAMVALCAIWSICPHINTFVRLKKDTCVKMSLQPQESWNFEPSILLLDFHPVPVLDLKMLSCGFAKTFPIDTWSNETKQHESQKIHKSYICIYGIHPLKGRILFFLIISK